MDFGGLFVWRRVTRSRGNLPIHLSLFIHGSNRSIDGVKMKSKPQDNLNGIPQRLFFLRKKARLEQISMNGQTVYFGLNTISSFSKAVIKKNGKRDALALQDLGILIKLNRGLRKEAQKRKQKRKRSTHSWISRNQNQRRMQGIFGETERFQFDGNRTWGEIRINRNPWKKFSGHG